MINRKISRILGPVLGIMGFILTVGIIEIPAFADDNVTIQKIVTETSNATADVKQDSFININKSVTQNGFKVTIDKVAASKHKLKAIVKIESNNPIDRKKIINPIEEITYGENNFYGGGSKTFEYPDDKTMIMTASQKSDNTEIPQKGDLRVDVVLPEYKVNIGIDVPVDFTEQFKDIIEKDLSAKISGYDFTFNKLEASDLGTSLTYTEKSKDTDGKDEFDNFYNFSMILKIGDRMYKTKSSGRSSSSDKNGERVTTGAFESELATYNIVKNEKNLSIVPIVCNISWDEINKLNRGKITTRNETNAEDDGNSENNISYEKSFDFNDGTKGQIYNIERNGDIIKVYCKGNTEKESLLMASNMRINYNNIKGKDTFAYYNNNNLVFYKDPTDNLGYIIEFHDVQKDKKVKVTIDDMIKYVDKFKIGDEIQVSK